jgi:hypothetical protein
MYHGAHKLLGTCYHEHVDDEAFREFLLELSGPSRDRAKLARLLGVSESTAYGWIRLSEAETFGPTTAVRGDANKHGLATLVRAAQLYAEGANLADIESRLLDEQAAKSAPAPPDRDAESAASAARRAMLQRGLQHAMRRLNENASLDEVLGAVDVVVAMARDG